MKNEKSYKYLNYKNLEFFNKTEDRYQSLNSYILENNHLSSYLSSLNDNYLIAFKNNINFINKYKMKNKIKNFRVNKIQYLYY